MTKSMIISVATTERVTITLPVEFLRDMDRIEKNRSRFILQAVRHELERRRREELRRSLDRPHREGPALAEAGFDDWATSLPDENASDLLDMKAGSPVRWIEGKGWVEGDE
jgi:hypothetical protein